MKILILNYEYPPLGGGAGSITKSHARALAASGHQVTVVTGSEREEYYEELEIENLIIVRLSSLRKHAFRSGMREKLDWMFKAKTFVQNPLCADFDICMAHFSLPGGAAALALKRKHGVPYGVISHGQDIPWFYPKQMFFYHLLTAPFIKLILNHADKLWVQSRIMQENAQRFLGRQKHKIEVIPNGCDATAIRDPKPAPGGTIRLLFAGRLTQQKRPDKLIKVAQLLSKKGVNFKLTIAGDGILRNSLEKETRRLNLTGKVHFAGLIPRKNMPELYARHDILLAPSEAEGMSISILEALFAGMYIITTPVSGNEELITQKINGEITTGVPGNIAAAIERFKNMEMPMDRRKKHYRDFVQKYDWREIVKQYETSLYHVTRSR